MSPEQKKTREFFDKLTDTILDDLGEPLDRVGSAFTGISEIIKETKNDKILRSQKDNRDLRAPIVRSHKQSRTIGMVYLGQ